MTVKTLKIQSLDAKTFEPYGQVIQREGANKLSFNDGAAHRFHDLAKVTASGDQGHAIISIAASTHADLPLRLEKLERHPLGSQAFIPLSATPFLVVVAPDIGGKPGNPLAFITNGMQGINYNQGTWHGVLTPLFKTSEFLVVDPEGNGNNCDEYMLDFAYQICF